MKRLRSQNRRYTIKLYRNNKLVHTFHTGKLRRFSRRVRGVEMEKEHLKVYIKVYYGHQYNADNLLVAFKNDGVYSNKQDLIKAYEAFIE